MMNTEQFVFLLSVLLVISFLLMGVQLLNVRSNRRRITKLESMLDELQNDFNALCSGTVGIGKRIGRLESRTRQQAERQSRLEHQAPDLQNYGNAARLANKGADMDELMEHCGLSRGEAELILFLNSQQQSTSTH